MEANEGLESVDIIIRKGIRGITVVEGIDGGVGVSKVAEGDKAVEGRLIGLEGKAQVKYLGLEGCSPVLVVDRLQADQQLDSCYHLDTQLAAVQD